MVHIPKRRGWEIPERHATPEGVYINRRAFLKALGVAGAGIAIGGTIMGTGACGTPSGRSSAPAGGADTARAGGPALRPEERGPDIYPAPRNGAFTLDRPLTDEKVAATYNNFYEFTEKKDEVWRMVEKFRVRPWRIEVAGLVEKPREIDVDDLVRTLPAEERLYRHRCVEAWAMAVPWTGIPMRRFVAWAKPTSAARFVRMVSFLEPGQAPNQQTATWYNWPYYEALRMDEAVNELALLAVGVYGHDLPKQHGAPIRLVTPWKYGYKSAKSIVRFEFTAEQPRTFWNDAAPKEYGFLSNVNPEVPHPRWSQASERMIDTGERLPTRHFNGYGDWVAELYG